MNLFFWAWGISSVMALVYCLSDRQQYLGRFVLYQFMSAVASAFVGIIGTLAFIFVCVIVEATLGWKGDKETLFVIGWNVSLVLGFALCLICMIKSTENEILQQRLCQKAEQEEAERQEEERQESVWCGKCRRGEAIEFFGREVLGSDQQYETVMRCVNQMNEMPNPNFMGYDWANVQDLRRTVFVQGSHSYPEQVLVTYTKIRTVYKCKYCGHKTAFEETLRKEGGKVL